MGVSGHRSASPIVHGSRILVGSSTIIGGSSSPTVAIGILSLLGWKKSAAIMSAAPFVYAVEFLYWLIARNRRLMSRLQDIDKVDPGIITPDTTPASKETAPLKEGDRRKNRSQ